MAQSTNEIKQRIRGISNTMKITKAMELVSTAKMRKSRIQLEKSRPYYTTVLSSINRVLANSNINHPLLEKREVKKSLYIVITSDKGLAGGYNSNINRLVHSEYENNIDKICLITVGTKAKDFFSRRGYEIIADFKEISEEPTFSDARLIGDIATELYKEKKVDEIKVVYTEFVTTLSYKPTVMKLLPADLGGDDEDVKNSLIEFEPSPEVALDYLIPKYIDSSIFGALIEGSASEQASRRTAMKAATENAEEMIEDLNMTYNRARQAAITMEISEIVSGADALN